MNYFNPKFTYQNHFVKPLQDGSQNGNSTPTIQINDGGTVDVLKIVQEAISAYQNGEGTVEDIIKILDANNVPYKNEGNKLSFELNGVSYNIAYVPTPPKIINNQTERFGKFNGTVFERIESNEVDTTNPIITETLESLKSTVETRVAEILGKVDADVVNEILAGIKTAAEEWLSVYTGVADALPVAIPEIMNAKMEELLTALVPPQADVEPDNDVTTPPPTESQPTPEADIVKESVLLSEINPSDFNVQTLDIDYSTIPGYYSNDKEKVSDSADGRESIVKILEQQLKAQLKEQLTAQAEAMGIKFSDIEDLFNNVFLQTAWNTVNSFDAGLKIKYTMKELVDKFLTDFNANFVNTLTEINVSDKDFDLTDLDYSTIVDNYDVESGEKTNTGSRNGAHYQTEALANELKPQLKTKAQQMCEANGVEYNDDIFNMIFNNALAYAKENCDMNFNDKKYNADQFLEQFLNQFKTAYTAHVDSALSQASITTKSSISDVASGDLSVDTNLIDYSSINGYYTNDTEKVSDSASNKEDLVKMLERNLKSQLKSQIAAQVQAMGLSFEVVENLFNNIFLQTAWDSVNSFDAGAKIKYTVAKLVDMFIVSFNANFDSALVSLNNSNKDFDLLDMDYTSIVDKYDVESGEKDKIGKKNSAKLQAEAIANELKSQLLAKAKAMCDANGIPFNLNAFNTQFNNSVAYALEHSDMSNNNKKYNATMFLETFLNTFKANYSAWVARQ